MKNIKGFNELNENDDLSTNPNTRFRYRFNGFPGGIKIKMVADVTDTNTDHILKKFWESWNEETKKDILEDMGHSEKYYDYKYEDLTGEIKSKLVYTTVLIGDIGEK